MLLNVPQQSVSPGLETAVTNFNEFE